MRLSIDRRLMLHCIGFSVFVISNLYGNGATILYPPDLSGSDSLSNILNNQTISDNSNCSSLDSSKTDYKPFTFFFGMGYKFPTQPIEKREESIESPQLSLGVNYHFKNYPFGFRFISSGFVASWTKTMVSDTGFYEEVVAVSVLMWFNFHCFYRPTSFLEIYCGLGYINENYFETMIEYNHELFHLLDADVGVNWIVTDYFYINIGCVFAMGKDTPEFPYLSMIFRI